MFLELEETSKARSLMINYEKTKIITNVAKPHIKRNK